MSNRHQARQSIIEILYAWDSSQQDPITLKAQLQDRLALEERKDQDKDFIHKALEAIVPMVVKIDEALSKVVRGRSIRSIGKVELSVLRLASWELMQRSDIPYRVVINEALELTNMYADIPARNFINGVLDQLASSMRSGEYKAKK
ncbi:MAG: transcription antitermination factor NusB [Mariprofundaceae bacterium]|nr:transcription antitermination factor NusB [Mariprofundaceae bacterium]